MWRTVIDIGLPSVSDKKGRKYVGVFWVLYGSVLCKQIAEVNLQKRIIFF